ncbi:MAG: fibronectin type III domain-containing protein [Methanosarcinales archaeon]|nr:fibronectin type III domain-containing protein [Methanosarcinales archaeon]
MKNINTILILISIAILCMAAQSAQSAPIVSFEPSYHNVLQGDLFTMNITVDPQGVETMGAQYYIHFDNTMLNATEQIEGLFLSNDGADTLIMPNRFNNTIGLIEYGETRIGVTNGVTSPGILATITFLANEPGVVNLDMSDVILSDPDANEIPGVIVNNATVNISETHFDISGYVNYDNGNQVLGPDVTVTDLNTSEIFIAQVNDSSNYYLISTNFAHISSDHVLHFDASDDLGNSSSFDYTVTHVEMDAEGFVQNITLIIPDTSPPVITNIIADDITKESATIIWNTDELSDSIVKYATSSGDYTQTVYNPENTVHHSIDLTGLALDTTYYYVVNSTDASSNSAESMEYQFTTFPEIIVVIDDAVAMTGDSAVTSLMITNISNVGTADISLTYNQSVVQVIEVTNSDFDFMDADIDNMNGITRIGAFRTSSGGLNGDVVIANITLLAAGSGGVITTLDLTINELKQASSQEIPIPASVMNGTFTVWETASPVVTDPVSDPPFIPEDTDLDPRWGETSQLRVAITDQCGIADVTIDLSSIGGMPDQAMIPIPDTDIWIVTVNASGGRALFNETYLPHNLTVCAVDTFGNVNTSVSIPLTVILNGDVSSNGNVTLYDASYLANYILNKPGFETMNEHVADVSGNGVASFYDAMYLSKYVLAESGYEVLH